MKIYNMTESQIKNLHTFLSLIAIILVTEYKMIPLKGDLRIKNVPHHYEQLYIF